MIVNLVKDALHAGARMYKACKMVGISERNLRRWSKVDGGADGRQGPLTPPANKLSRAEVENILHVVNLPEYRDLPPGQIVPDLADKGAYYASESTIHRILRREKQNTHRSPARPATRHRPDEHLATGPNQVFTWDITYLKAPVAGEFYYLYMIQDIWSRKIVGWAVHDREGAELGAELIEEVADALGIDSKGLVLHSDNGSPMKGATMVATLQRLGVVPSFSRPSVSNDNPFVEALFRTMKYRPEFPSGRFGSLATARRWVDIFARWYNRSHKHSSLNYVTPEQRHSGAEVKILRHREKVYEAARRRNPERWSGKTRSWAPAADVVLNPANEEKSVSRRTETNAA